MAGTKSTLVRRLTAAGLVGLSLLVVTSVTRADPTTDPAATRAALHRLLDRPAVPLDPQTRPLPDHDGLPLTHLTFTSEPGQVVPAILLSPAHAEGKLPVVIVLHGTGGYKEQNLPLMTALAKAGFLAVSPDGRYHGERCAAGKGTVDYYHAIAQAYVDGKSHPWLFDTAYDVTRLIDYLQTRPDVDATRIGLIGFSKGGMETYLTAAADERVAVAVPCISVQDFAWELAHDQWHYRISTVQGAFDAAAKHDGVEHPDAAFVKTFYDRVVPGIDGVLNCPDVLPLICPRPLLTINGETDKLNPLPSTEIALAATKSAYAAAGVSDRFKAEIEPKTAHDVTPAYRSEAIEWFVQWLKPTPAK